MISKRPFFLFLAPFFLLFALPYLFVVVGDAQVHLAVAEHFANGRFFQYNPNGETVVASTSPFWTLLLAFFYRLVGRFAPLLLKLTAVLIWGITAVLLQRTARDRWQFSPNTQLIILALWLGHTTIVSNALGGLENSLSALQLLWLYSLITAPTAQTPWPLRRSVHMGLLTGWAMLTRPDGGLFLLTLLGLYALFLLKTAVFPHWLRQCLPRFLLIGLIALLVMAPWYLFQYRVTGQLVTDSSVARLYNGRLGSLMLIPNQLYLHPKALISLATAFLPLSVGYLVYTWQLFRLRQWEGITAVLITLTGFLFYTFVVGAEAFGRYFLPLYPFLFLTGIAGLQHLYHWLGTYNQLIGRVFLILTILFLATTSLLDSYRRLIPGQFSVNTPLDIIYGPAHQQYVSYNLLDLVTAPTSRTTTTATLAQQLDSPLPIRFAVTEVQLRYFLDERVEILSLDGRTSASILNYTNPTTGVPDFPRYFQAVRPDYVHINQWCTVGGFLASLFPTNISDNLVCQWQKTAENLTIGDSFPWQNNTITLVAPEIVKISWQDG